MNDQATEISIACKSLRYSNGVKHNLAIDISFIQMSELNDRKRVIKFNHTNTKALFTKRQACIPVQTQYMYI